MSAVSDVKALIRAQMKVRRALLASERPYAGDALAQMAAGWFAEHGWPVGVVAGYWPVQSEINPLPLMERIREQGGSLALPVLEGENDLRMRFRAFDPGDELVVGPFGLSQPAPDKAELQPDAVLLPLLAFDAKGVRLGYGGGWYDRALAPLRARRDVRCYGVAYSDQYRDDLPLEVHDQRMDAILTDQSVVSVTE